MLALEVNNEELLKRLLIRGKDSGRPDDQNEDVIRRRIQEYNNKTLPLKEYYSEQGKFHSIDGIGSIDEIFQLLVERITFLGAEMDLTALETDLEHLDLTIQDFEVANDIAPELLLEIDAIKRAEAEEAEEEAVARKSKAKANKVTKKPGLRQAQAPLKKAAKKAAVKKPASKKPAAKKPGLRQAQAPTAKKVVAKKAGLRQAQATAKKTVAKKVVKKATPKKKVAKKAAKPVKKGKASKPAVKKVVAKKPAKKAVKKKGAKRK